MSGECATMCRMTTTPPFDPGEPIRRELARALAPLAQSLQEVSRAASPTAKFAAGLQYGIGRTYAAQFDLRGFRAMERQIREAQEALARQVRGAQQDYERAAEQLARIGGGIAFAATVRAVADPTARPAERPVAEPDPHSARQPVEPDVQSIVTAAVREVTGDQPEGWRWLFCTPVGLAAFAAIILAAAQLLWAIADSSPTVHIENSPGATVYVQTEEKTGPTVVVSPPEEEDPAPDRSTPDE